MQAKETPQPTNNNHPKFYCFTELRNTPMQRHGCGSSRAAARSSQEPCGLLDRIYLGWLGVGDELLQRRGLCVPPHNDSQLT